MNDAKPDFMDTISRQFALAMFLYVFVKRRFLIHLNFATELSIKDFVLSLFGCMTKSILTDGVYFISFERIRNFVKGELSNAFTIEATQLCFKAEAEYSACTTCSTSLSILV